MPGMLSGSDTYSIPACGRGICGHDMTLFDTNSTYLSITFRDIPPSGTQPLLPIPLPTPSPPFLLPSAVCRAGVFEVTLPPHKRLYIAIGLRFEDTDEIYRRLDDAQDDASLMSGQLNMLHRDRHAYARTARLIKSEARLSREAWVQSIDASDTARSEVRALRTTVLVQQTEIRELQVADRRRQTQLTENKANCSMENSNQFSTCIILEVLTVYAVGSGEKKPLRWILKPSVSTANANIANNEKGTGAGQKPTCYECGAQVHFKRECLKMKNNNRGNQGGNGNALAKVYAVGRTGTNPDSNIVTGTFLLNNRYASVLFDTGANRSFVYIAFSSQIDITPSTLDHYYDVELADGRIIGLNAIIQGCTLNFLNHPFNIDLMSIELGSFDVIISMDWLARYQAIIVCAEKIVRIP
ncbi:putative reverse transcriptase domain-containing protein [Tanacetum coccineum]